MQLNWRRLYQSKKNIHRKALTTIRDLAEEQQKQYRFDEWHDLHEIRVICLHILQEKSINSDSMVVELDRLMSKIKITMSAADPQILKSLESLSLVFSINDISWIKEFNKYQEDVEAKKAREATECAEGCSADRPNWLATDSQRFMSGCNEATLRQMKEEYKGHHVTVFDVHDEGGLGSGEYQSHALVY